MERDRLLEMPRGYYADARRLSRFPIPAASPLCLQTHDTRVDTMNSPQSGGCLCGAVHYEITGPPVIV